MTREHAKEIAPLLAAYAEGKTIQFKTNTRRGWTAWDMNQPLSPGLREYRINPKPQTVLMTVDDFLEGVIWLKDNSRIMLITVIYDNNMLEVDGFPLSIKELNSKGVLWSTNRKNWKPLTKVVSA